MTHASAKKIALAVVSKWLVRPGVYTREADMSALVAQDFELIGFDLVGTRHVVTRGAYVMAWTP
jgi:hypothetical protein